MAISTSSSQSLIPATQPNSEGVKPEVTRLQALAKDDSAHPGFQTVAGATNKLQNQINLLMNALRKPLPLPEDFHLTDPAGNEVIFLGVQSGSNFIHSGLRVFIPGLVEAAWVGVRAETPLPITATTNASPDVVSVASHPYVNGDTLYIFGATGDTAINGLRIVENTAPGTFRLTDLLGNVINGNGAYAGGGMAQRYYGGAFFETVGIGGSDIGNAKIRAFADGNVRILNALIELIGSNATIVLDPTTGRITVTGTLGGSTDKATIDGSGIIVSHTADSTAIFVNTTSGLIVLNSLGNVVAQLSVNAGIEAALGYTVSGNTIVDNLRNAFFNSLKIGVVQTIDSSNNAIFNSVNSLAYKINSVPGVNKSALVLTGFTTATLQYKDWTGTNVSATVVTGINTSILQVSGGIVTT